MRKVLVNHENLRTMRKLFGGNCMPGDMIHVDREYERYDRYTRRDRARDLADDILDTMPEKVAFYRTGRTIFCAVFSNRCVRGGKATANLKDEYDENIGKAIAYMRATGKVESYEYGLLLSLI